MNQQIKSGKMQTNKSILPVNDPVKFFIETKRDSLWKKNQEKWKAHFRLQLKVLKLFIDNQANEKHLKSFAYRLAIGYWGVGIQNGISSGIYSMNAITSENTRKTNDHLIGAQLIGKTVHEAFMACDFDENYMVDYWLYENIWMFMTIRVTQDEHKSCNISKTITDIEEKKMLGHYINVSQLVTIQKGKY